jgi:hypothetical protein
MIRTSIQKNRKDIHVCDNHLHFGANCPAANRHLTDNNDKEAYHPAEEGNPALEDEGYVRHEDKEGNSES